MYVYTQGQPFHVEIEQEGKHSGVYFLISSALGSLILKALQNSHTQPAPTPLALDFRENHLICQPLRGQ